LTGAPPDTSGHAAYCPYGRQLFSRFHGATVQEPALMVEEHKSWAFCHPWIIEPASGSLSQGRCRKWQAVREFSNATDGPYLDPMNPTCIISLSAGRDTATGSARNLTRICSAKGPRNPMVHCFWASRGQCPKPLGGPGSHFLPVTVVPCPRTEAITHSSISRLLPAQPTPNPPAVPLPSGRA
jgi:hypothetical protein